MSLISELEYERNRYYRLIDNVKSICNYLDDSSNHIDSAIEQLNKFYRIDEEKADNNKLKETANNINNVRSVLVDKIIPSISNKISQLNSEISRLQELETVI